METSFTELRNKEVINVLTGRLLGNVCDIIIDLRRNCVLGLMVPGTKSFFNIFKSPQEIFIPFCNICKIGEDVILVEVIEAPTKKSKGNKPVRVFDAGESQKEEYVRNDGANRSINADYPTNNYQNYYDRSSQNRQKSTNLDQTNQNFYSQNNDTYIRPNL